MNQLKIYVAFEGKTTDPALLSKVLTTLSQLELLAPGYWGAHERERKSWDVEAIIAFVARMKEEYRFYTSVSDARAAYSTRRADSRNLPMWTDEAREIDFYAAGGTAIGPTSRARARGSRRARVASQNLGASSRARSAGQ